MAQHADQDALADADDAFGTNIGLERTGIYTEYNTRGFKPLDAGNARIDGIYFDQVAILSSELRQTSAIRVGFGATDMPFIAPTGVVDNATTRFPQRVGGNLNTTRFYYGGHVVLAELHTPLIEDRIGISVGAGHSYTGSADGSEMEGWAAVVRPFFRFGRMEFSPFVQFGGYPQEDVRPLTVVRNGYVPVKGKTRRYLGQKWAEGRKTAENFGATLNGSLTDWLSFRGGIFRSVGDRQSSFSEIYNIADAGGEADHFLFADPKHKVSANSGEGLFALTLRNGRATHRIFAGYRARNRLTETGGSDFFDFGRVAYPELDPQPEPEFDFLAPNAGRVRQSSWMLGYLGRVEGLGHVNLGIQKADYRASFRNGETGERDVSTAKPWLYNATVQIEMTDRLSVYAGTQRGLEDSGTAPENATNRNEQLPATRTTQYEGGLRWKSGRNSFIVAAFEITKPYFSSDDASGRFIQLGKRRHRGIEFSANAHFGEGTEILAGAVLMDPVVSGAARETGLVGKRPAGTPRVYAQVNVNYRTDILNGLTLVGVADFTGKRAATSGIFPQADGGQVTLPGFATVDLGMRHRFSLGGVHLALRVMVENVLDKRAWSVVAPDVLQPDDKRRMIASLYADF